MDITKYLKDPYLTGIANALNMYLMGYGPKSSAEALVEFSNVKAELEKKIANKQVDFKLGNEMLAELNSNIALKSKLCIR